MGKTLTIEEVSDWLKTNDNFLILTHRRPDGDTVGSAGALAQGLREIGKTAFVLNNPEITPRYSRFIEEYLAADGYKPEYVIAIDTASDNLLPKNGDKFIGAVSLCIDHHPSNSLSSEMTCIDSGAASCGEVIYEVLIALSGNISPVSAERLYVAVSTDTGCFVYANTNAKTLRVASLLVEAGAPNRKINRMLFRTKTRGRIRIESMITSGLEFHFDGKVAIAAITIEMMKSANAEEDDVDDIASVSGMVEGVQAGITIREMIPEKDCKVSVRTSPQISAQAICERFGGGGHSMAGGFSLEKPVNEVKKALLEVLKDFF